jgi:hypothetical protein
MAAAATRQKEFEQFGLPPTADARIVRAVSQLRIPRIVITPSSGP